VPVCATTIFASNAGALPGTAEDLTGLFPTEIMGSVSDPTDALLGVNMFKIQVLEPTLFSALVIGQAFGIPDTVLSLFDASGVGVYLNDDMGGVDPDTFGLSCLPAAVGNPCISTLPSGVGPIAAGIYYLAISLSSNYPTSASGEIFSPASSTDVVGPANGDPITGWDGQVFTNQNTDDTSYDILLTGTTPEPATWIMTGMAFVSFLLIRRFYGRLTTR
jgi:hypothetical protein